jgi:hypothetical protein
MDSLWALWDERFDERPNHHHRTWLESRLAYKIQDRAFGGFKPATRRKLEEIGETGILPRQLRRDARRTAWQTTIKVITTGILAALRVGAAIKLKLMGGPQ